MTPYFTGRILGIDAPVAGAGGRFYALADCPLPAIDSLLAATAMHRGLILVTRNLSDFALPGLRVVNPWNHPA